MLYKFFICFLAGVGAGLGTGFAGMSAAAVISPMLITFLGVPAYEAVGIALASDVLASAVSAYTYGKNKNLDVKNGLVMMAAVLCFTLVGSWVSSLVPSSTMGGFSVFMTLLLGVKFIVRPVMTTKENMAAVSARKRFFQSVACGVLVGFICGFIGAGGGMMMLLVLTSVLGFELKTAVGTSVFIMTFTAFTGAVSHFAIGGAPDVWCLVFCVASTLLWAQVAAKFANKASPIVLNRATGVVLTVLGAAILAVNYQSPGYSRVGRKNHFTLSFRQSAQTILHGGRQACHGGFSAFCIRGMGKPILRSREFPAGLWQRLLTCHTQAFYFAASQKLFFAVGETAPL